MASTPWGDQMSAQQATASVMVHSKLTAEAGMASASAAAQQAKLKLQKKHQQELLEAALTPPQQRTNAQVSCCCQCLWARRVNKHGVRQCRGLACYHRCTIWQGSPCSVGKTSTPVQLQGVMNKRLWCVVAAD
jgi:hypothetical protein